MLQRARTPLCAHTPAVDLGYPTEHGYSLPYPHPAPSIISPILDMHLQGRTGPDTTAPRQCNFPTRTYLRCRRLPCLWAVVLYMPRLPRLRALLQLHSPPPPHFCLYYTHKGALRRADFHHLLHGIPFLDKTPWNKRFLRLSYTRTPAAMASYGTNTSSPTTPAWRCLAATFVDIQLVNVLALQAFWAVSPLCLGHGDVLQTCLLSSTHVQHNKAAVTTFTYLSHSGEKISGRVPFRPGAWTVNLV